MFQCHGWVLYLGHAAGWGRTAQICPQVRLSGSLVPGKGIEGQGWGWDTEGFLSQLVRLWVLPLPYEFWHGTSLCLCHLSHLWNKSSSN